MFRNSRPVNLATAATGADIVWTTAAAGAALGSTVLAVGRARGISPFILASSPGALVTHLLSDVKPPTSTPRQLDAGAADHPTFTGVAAAALGGGELDEAPDSGKPLDIALGDPTYRDTSEPRKRAGGSTCSLTSP